MTTFSQSPVSTANRLGGLGLWVTQAGSSPTSTLSTLGRRVFDHPLSPGNYNIGFPVYQMGQALRDTGSPVVHTYLHANLAKIVIRIPLTPSTDPNSITHALSHDLAAYPSGGVGFAACNLKGGADPYGDQVVVLSVPNPGNTLGIDVTVGFGPFTPTGTPLFTSAALGFSGTDVSTSKWTGFTAFPVLLETGERFVYLLASLQRTGRSRVGDLTKTVVYVVKFAISALNVPALVWVKLANTDVPFSPHQGVTGRFLDVSSGPGLKSMAWTSGRCDPEHDAPLLTGLQPTGAASHGTGLTSNSAGIGVWACKPEDDFLVWRRIHTSAFGVSHSPLHQASPTLRPAGNPDRSVGLAYNEAWQRLQLGVIDTDSSQDPVIERPDRTLPAGPPV